MVHAMVYYGVTWCTPWAYCSLHGTGHSVNHGAMAYGLSTVRLRPMARMNCVEAVVYHGIPRGVSHG